MRITHRRLIESGFKFEEWPQEIPSEKYVKDGIEIWKFNDNGYLVDALDQGGINVYFRSMEHLQKFFEVCGKKLEIS